jgi:zinc/manganese transport system substrate-binding protein
VAAESSWGSIAAQLGGDRVEVTSIIASPDVDPHDYEPTVSDARAIASARYVLVNGLGYDGWAAKTADANDTPDQARLDVGAFLGLRNGANPHRWYFPEDVHRVIGQITSDLQRLDPENASYYERRRYDYEMGALQRYHALLTAIEQYRGTAVGASESIFSGIAQSTGLAVLTPASFMAAVSEGTDPAADDKATVDEQLTRRQVAVFVVNPQNSTPDVQALVDEARASGVEVVSMTETAPRGASFEDWQAGQLAGLLAALTRAAHR